MASLEIGKVYTFSTNAPAILGASIENAKLKFSADYSFAMTRANVAVRYRAVYPSLPQGSPESPEGVIFHFFTSESGEEIYVADPWIDQGSVKVITHRPFQVVFASASNQDQIVVRNALNTLGIPYTLTNL